MHLPHHRRPRMLPALAAVAALCTAVPALAAQITAVRVGAHPKYTRIVFELDGRAGYRVERVGTDAAPELRITIEASSSARELRSSGDVRGVKVDAGTKARAHIALRQSGLRVREMMMSDPPRIVLDVMKPETALAAAGKPAQSKPTETKAAQSKPAATKAPEAKPAETKPQSKIAEIRHAGSSAKPTPPAPAPAPKASPAPEAPKTAQAPKPAPVPEAPKPAPVPEAPKTAQAPKPAPVPEVPKTAQAPKPAPAPEALKTAEAPKAAATPAPTPALPPAPPSPTAPGAKLEGPAITPPQSAQAPVPTPSAITPPPAVPPTPEGVAKLPPAEPKPMPPTAALPAPVPKPVPAPQVTPAAPSEPEMGWSERLTSDPIWMGAAAAALLGLGTIVLVLRRRRALPNDLDVTAIADEVEESSDDEFSEASGRIPSGGFAMDDVADTPITSNSPFGGLFEKPAGPLWPAAPLRPAAQPAAAENSLFDDAGDSPGDSDATEGDAPMEQEMEMPRRMTPPAARMGGSAAPSPAPSPDFTRMFQELERKIATLEARLDESNEAREKLERQVAAQSEELRVQRAAIARTQRALRTMNRGEEDKASEPALRDGDTQAKTRVTP